MKAGDSPRNVPKQFKVSHVQPDVKAKFDPSETDESPCVSPTDDACSASFYSAQYFSKWRRAAVVVATASLLVSLTLAVLGLISTAEFSSSVVLASAADTTLAVVGSIVVLWRFRDTAENEGKRVQKESLGSLIYGAMFEINGAVTIAVAVYHIMNADRASGTVFLVVLLSVTTMVYISLAAAEFYVSRKLRSSVLAALCVDDALTAAMHLGLVVGKVLNERIPSMWYLDHYTAIGVAFLIFCCGFKILVDVLIFKDLPFQTFFG